MAENANPSSQQNGGANGQPPARPDYVPEKFWDATAGSVRLEDLAKGYGELSSKLGNAKETLRTELEAERLKGRPAKAEDYAIKLPEKGAPEGLVLLNQAPGDDFKPEAGKRYFVVDQKDPLLGWWRKHAFESGLGQEGFMQGIVAFADAQAARQPTAEQLQAANKAEWAKLGEHGEARAQHAWGRLKGLLGEDKAKALEGVVGDAAAVEAVEMLLEKAGEPKFSAQNVVDAGDPKTLKEEADGLMRSDDYWSNQAKQNRVAEIYKKLYPGQVDTAATDRHRAA